MTIKKLVDDMRPLLSNRQGNHGKKNESMTSLCALLYNGGCIVYSDLQATSAGRVRSSTREDKIYQVGDDSILLAGTGSVAGIILAAENASKLIQYWRAKNELKPIPPVTAGEILREVMVPEDEAWFIMAGYDHQTDQGFICDVAEDGIIWQSDLYQVNGSGTNYMLSKAKDVARKVLGTTDLEVVITSDVYAALPHVNFPREAAMLEGLDVINSGPDCDVFSGGEGFQLMVVDSDGVSEYILPRALAQEILHEKKMAEFSAVNPRMKTSPFNGYAELFEKGRRR